MTNRITIILCCLIILHSITPILSILAYQQCSTDTRGSNTVNVEPYYVRETGGELLTIHLPCQTQQFDGLSVKCKFQSYPDNIIDGTKLGESQVACVTPPHLNLGIHEVFLSVDNGNSFGYVGKYSAQNKKVLKPYISVQNSVPLQDFSTNKEVTLSWDKTILSSPYLTLKLLMIVDPLAEVLNWDVSTVLIEKVENNGKLTFRPSDIVPKEIKFVKTPLTAASYQLSDPTSDRYITGPISVISFADIPIAICKLFDPVLEQVPRGTLPCPCSTTQANADKNYTIEDGALQNFFHPGVASCYRSIPSEFGSSEQCCYNADGSINLGTDGSGTADTYSPQVSSVKHAIYDVLPWFVCCKLGMQCDYYAKYRPIDDCSRYKPL